MRRLYNDVAHLNAYRVWTLIQRVYVDCDDVVGRIYRRSRRLRRVVLLRAGYDDTSDEEAETPPGVDWNSFADESYPLWAEDLLGSSDDTDTEPIEDGEQTNMDQ